MTDRDWKVLEAAREHVNGATRELEDGEDFIPFMTFLRHNGECGIVHIPLCGCPDHLQHFGDGMAATLAAYRATEAAFALLAVTVEMTAEELAAWGDKPIEDHPRLQERVVVLNVWRQDDGEFDERAITAQVRRERGLVVLESWDDNNTEDVGTATDTTGMALLAAVKYGLKLAHDMPSVMVEKVDAAVEAGDVNEVIGGCMRAINTMRRLRGTVNPN